MRRRTARRSSAGRGTSPAAFRALPIVSRQTGRRRFQSRDACWQRSIPAAPTAAYCERNNSCALADHGISSQSRQAHVVVNSSQNRPRQSRAHAFHKGAVESQIIEESPPGSGIDDSRLACRHSEPLARSVRVPAGDHHRREPMCFSSHTTCGTPGCGICERLRGCSSSPGSGDVSHATSSVEGRLATSDRPPTGSSPPAQRWRSPGGSSRCGATASRRSSCRSHRRYRAHRREAAGQSASRPLPVEGTGGPARSMSARGG